MESNVPEIIISDESIEVAPVGDIQYLIILLDEIDLVDFTKIQENNIDTIKKSVDGTKTIIKWYGEEPDFVGLLSYKDGPMSYEEILDIVSTEKWNPEIDKV
jgi:hypothetical protein